MGTFFSSPSECCPLDPARPPARAPVHGLVARLRSSQGALRLPCPRLACYRNFITVMGIGDGDTGPREPGLPDRHVAGEAAGPGAGLPRHLRRPGCEGHVTACGPGRVAAAPGE